MTDDSALPNLGYRLATRLAVPLLGRLLTSPAARTAHIGRLSAPETLERWAATHRDPTRPLLWIHAASVGESLQSLAILHAFRPAHPEVQIVVTRFSASAERIASHFPADIVTYVPYDRPDDVRRAVQAVRPTLLAFSKLDIWPALLSEAKRLGAHTALVAGTVDPESSRLRWPTRRITRRSYQSLDRLGAIDASDAERLVMLGAIADRITVTGDPRVDSALARLAARPTGVGDPVLLVAGSTWRIDEEHLLAAFHSVRTHYPAARLALVPHEPTDAALQSIDALAQALGLPAVARDDLTAPLSVVTQMGVLAERYSEAGIGYVGGGFGRRGIHSVLEPAASRLPILIGPFDRGVRDARLLSAAGGLVRLPADRPVEALTAQWLEWLRVPAQARRAGDASYAALAADRGAADRSARILSELVSQPPRSRR